jgi:hypothetical protein
MQVKIPVRARRRNVNIRRRRRQRHFDIDETASAQGYSTIDDSAPDRHGLRERVGEAFTRARRVYENESGTREPDLFLFRGKVKEVMATYPPWEAATDSRWIFGRRRLKDQFP